MKSVLAGYAGKKVFITGHTGFKGTWLTFILNKLGANITGFALPPPSGPSHFEMLNLRSRIHHVEGDIRDGALLSAAMNEAQPEFVFHLAAQALVRRSYHDPKGVGEGVLCGSAEDF